MTTPSMPDAARLAARSVSHAARHLGIPRSAARARVRLAAITAAARLQASGHGTPPWLAAIVSALSRQEETNTMPDQKDQAEPQVTYANATGAATAWLNHAMADEETGGMVILEAGPYTTLVLICALRLALRHPAMPAGERKVLEAYANQWTKAYAGTPVEDMALSGTMPYLAAPGTGPN